MGRRPPVSRNGQAAVVPPVVVRPRKASSVRRRLINASRWRSAEIELRPYVRGVERVLSRARLQGRADGK